MRHHGLGWADAEKRYESTQDLHRLKASGKWKCKRCGNVKPVGAFCMNKVNGKPALSYCLPCRKDWNKEQYHRDWETKFIRNAAKNIVSRSPRLGVPNNVDEKYLKALFDQQCGACALTGLTMTTEGGKGPYSASIDRIVPGLGYTTGNLRWVCLAVNYGMNKWGKDTFAVIAKAFVNYHVTLNNGLRSE